MVERDTAVETAVALAGAGIFVVATVVVGMQYGTYGSDVASDGVTGLTDTGGYVLVGSIVVFIVAMAVAGYILSTRD